MKHGSTTRFLRNSLHRCTRPARYRYLATLLDNAAMSRAQLTDKQQRALDDIVHHAVTHTDFYAGHYADIALNSPIDSATLPVLQKQHVLEFKQQMVDRDFPESELRLGHTGGSTGTPLAYYYHADKHELMRAGMCRSYMWAGWLPGEKVMNFWGARQDIKSGSMLKDTFKAFTAAEITLPAYQFTRQDLLHWFEKIRQYKPVLLQGYASILTELARFVSDNRLKLPATLKGVFSTAEVLYDWQRELMTRTFGCPVFNQYGSREVPNIACECAHGNMHVFTDMVVLESQHIEQENRLLVTSLTNRVMPFIRYNIGDSGTLTDERCACGSPFPLMNIGICRSNDIVHTENGRKIYPSYFIHLLDPLTGIRQFQFRQTGINELVIYLVAEQPQRADDELGISRKIRNDLGESMQVEFRYVDEIPRTHSGKHRFVLSEVACSR